MKSKLIRTGALALALVLLAAAPAAAAETPRLSLDRLFLREQAEDEDGLLFLLYRTPEPVDLPEPRYGAELEALYKVRLTDSVFAQLDARLLEKPDGSGRASVLFGLRFGVSL